MKSRPSNALLWFGVVGGPVAWAIEFVSGFAFGLAQCEQPAPRWQLPVHAWDVALAAAGVVIGLAAEAVALRIFLDTREADNGPPWERIHFLATIGLVVNFLALAIMVMTAVGTPLLPQCRQS